MEGTYMTFNEYQQEALRTASGAVEANADNLLLNGVMGLNGEAGECIDIVKKYLFQGHNLDKEHIASELGDVLWYVAIAAEGLGYKLDDIRAMNVSKLRNRYPNGFEIDKSVNRSQTDI